MSRSHQDDSHEADITRILKRGNVRSGGTVLGTGGLQRLCRTKEEKGTDISLKWLQSVESPIRLMNFILYEQMDIMGIKTDNATI